MYRLFLRKTVERTLRKLARLNPKQLEAIRSKLEGILANPHHFKNLRAPLQHLRRVHIEGSFVLVYSIDEADKAVVVEDFDHHDKVYKR
jgi:YafQ family addiction module toxin component